MLTRMSELILTWEGLDGEHGNMSRDVACIQDFTNYLINTHQTAEKIMYSYNNNYHNHNKWN